MRVRAIAAAATLLAMAACSAEAAGRGQAPRRFERVFVVVLENTDFAQAVAQPFLQQLAQRGALLTNFHGVAHPSYPNYLAMATGSTLGVRLGWARDLDATSLVDLLEAASLRWRVYAENLPPLCFRGGRSPDGLYVRRHQPFISLRNIRSNPARCARIIDATALAGDLAQNALPAYSLYIPNLDHSGHDTGIRVADAWLRSFLTPLLVDPRFARETLTVVTFDEDSGSKDNHIYTALVGSMVQPGARNPARYDHYSLLRTIEDNFSLGTLGREDAKATPICCVWRR